jgi:transposase
MDTLQAPGNRKGRPNYSIDFKRQVALAACEPGISVSKLAQMHELNANMVFKWRRELRAGLLEIAGGGPALLPVEVVLPETSQSDMPTPARPKVDAGKTKSIEIEITDA